MRAIYLSQPAIWLSLPLYPASMLPERGSSPEIAGALARRGLGSPEAMGGYLSRLSHILSRLGIPGI